MRERFEKFFEVNGKQFGILNGNYFEIVENTETNFHAIQTSISEIASERMKMIDEEQLKLYDLDKKKGEY